MSGPEPVVPAPRDETDILPAIEAAQWAVYELARGVEAGPFCAPEELTARSRAVVRTVPDLLDRLRTSEADRDRLAAKVTRIEALCDEYRANCDPTSLIAGVAERFRAALADPDEAT